MNKTLISTAFSLGITFFASAQIPGLNSTSAYDDFISVNNYGSFTNDLAWDEISNDPLKDSKAFKGIIWANTPSASGTRAGNGKIEYTINQVQGGWQPLVIYFGTYASISNEKAFYTLDLSRDANFSFAIKNVGNIEKLRVIVQVVDINDTYLSYRSGAQQDDFYYWFLGLDQGQSSAIQKNILTNYSVDLKTAIVGLGNSKEIISPTGNSTFDFTKVKMVLITIVQEANAGDAGNWQPLALVNYPVEISNFRLGDVSNIVTEIDSNEMDYNNKEEVSVYDAMGRFIGTGNLNSLGLEYGKLYMVKSGDKTRRIIIN